MDVVLGKHTIIIDDADLELMNQHKGWESLYVACQQEAASIVKKVKDLYSPNGIVDDARNGGGQYAGSAPSYNQSVGQMMQDYIQYLPSLTNATAAAQPAIDLSQAKSAAATAPVYNNATLSMFGKYAPALNAIGQQIGASNAASGVTTNANTLGNPAAQQMTQSANSLEAAANPEFYATRALTASKLGDLLNSINLNGLSGSERAEVERSLGQSQTATGNIGVDNATNAVGNAMTFGTALQAKRDALASAINTATSYLPQSKSTFDPVSMALGGNPATTTATGNATAQFSGVTPAGGQAFTMGNNTLNALNQNNVANQAMQFEANKNNSFAGILGSQTSAIGNVCCFIFLESYHGTLPWWVRKCRDRYYRVCPEVADGYRRMARWLVPMMRYVPGVRFAVWRWMVQPLTMYGGYLRRVEGYEDCQQFKPYRKFWFTLWQKLGKKRGCANAQ